MPAASRPPTLEQIVIRSSRERSAGDDIGGANVARKIQHGGAAAGRWIRRILVARAPAAASRSPRSPGERMTTSRAEALTT
jgi:hypothetical protein